MCPFYNAQLFEITGTTKGVFTHSQSSCHIAKVVLAFSHDSRQIPIASDAPPRHTSRGFLHWRFAYAGPGARRSTFMGPASENLHRSRHSPMDRRFITAAEIPISNVMEPQCLLGHLTRTVLTPSRRVPQLLLRHENLTDCQSAFKFDPGSAFNTPLCATGLTVALV